MKKNILYWGLCLILGTATLTSCNTDAEGALYSEGTGVSFASTSMSQEVSASNEGKILVPVYRSNTANNAEVQITIDENTVAENIFTLASSSVKFNEGENVAYAELNFDLNSLGATTTYNITLTIQDASQVSISGENSIKVVVKRQLTWTSFGTGVYYSEFFGESWPQTIEKAVEGNIYRLTDCYFKGYPIIFSLSEDGQKLVAWDIQATGYTNSTYGMVYFAAKDMIREDNVLNFPMQGVVSYNGGWGLLYDGFTETLELPAE